MYNFNKYISKLDFKLILILLIYLVLGLFFLNYYLYLFNSDAISYINIAQKYMAGDWNNAINGYWGPLLSWFMIPFLLFSSNPLENLYLSKLLSIFIGLFTIIGFKLLSDKFEIKGRLLTLFLVSLIPIMLVFSLSMITPDLLILCLLVFYLNYIFDDNYSSNIRNGLLCGIFGGLAFLTKSYAFIFFILHFSLFNVFYYFKNSSKNNKKVISKNFLIGISIFFIISGAWIGIISDKYGYTTFGTTGKYNYNIVGPESQGHPMYYQGLIKPPNDSAVSAWEDPSYFSMKSWSPLDSFSNLFYQINLLFDNILKILDILLSYSIFSLIIIMVAIIFIMKSDSKSYKTKIKCLLFTILIYSGLYALILVENRYLWLVYVLILMMGLLLIGYYSKVYKLNNFKNVLILLLILSFSIGPIIDLTINLDIEKNIYELGQDLKVNYNLNGKIASNTGWEFNTYLAYYLNSKYYGMTINNNDYNSVNNQLEENNIDYYFVWYNKEMILPDYKEVIYIKNWGLRIYSKV